MEAVIIGNPNSGRAGDLERLKRCAEILSERWRGIEVWPTERPGHATELAALAGDRVVIAAGGDGTINEVINGLSGGATLGILPLGTANVLAHELDLPLEPEKACQRILEGRRIRADLGVATNREGAERRFACMAGIGFDAKVVQAVKPHIKGLLRELAFVLAAVEVYAREDLPTAFLTQAGKTYEAQLAVVANSHRYGGSFRMASEGLFTSRELEVVFIERVSSLFRPDVIPRFLAREPLAHTTKSFRATELHASAPGAEVPVQLDGEIWGRLPMSFRVEPEALEVIC